MLSYKLDDKTYPSSDKYHKVYHPTRGMIGAYWIWNSTRLFETYVQQRENTHWTKWEDIKGMFSEEEEEALRTWLELRYG
jgi:hypothetical protein